MDPVFLNYRVAIKPLEYEFYDVQLKDHFRINTDIFLNKCKCIHKHNKTICPIRLKSVCKCQSPNRLFIPNQNLLFHFDKQHHIRKCLKCVHKHEAPCGKCLNCNTNLKCIVDKPFACNFTFNAICNSCNQLTENVEHSELIKYHLYNIHRDDLFYICKKHYHIHTNHVVSNKMCFIQAVRCCDEAINMKDFESSFFIYANVYNKKYNKYNYKKHIVFDPKIWTEQSNNSFVTWVNSILYDSDQVSKHYDSFINSNFKIPEIINYKSGGDSFIRNEVTGFKTSGLYQTAIISPALEEDCVLVPQYLWDKLEKDYFMDLAAVVRYPSFYLTSMEICKIKRNSDPDIQVIVLPCTLSKGMKQDQDGDKNGIFFLKLRVNGKYDRTKSFEFKLCKIEMSLALNNCRSLFSEPRYQFSEHNIAFLHRKYDIFKHNEFFARTFHLGHFNMMEAACGYLRSEYLIFRDLLIHENKKEDGYILNVYDYLQQNNTLKNIIDIGVKTNARLLDVFNDSLTKKPQPLMSKLHGLDGLVPQMNRYIDSSKKLSTDGHIEFKLIYNKEGVIMCCGILWNNEKRLGDFKRFSNLYSLTFNKTSLKLCIEDILNSE